jgi:hypothetical protein
MPWSARFQTPVKLPDGGALTTLESARAYILKLPKADQQSEAWQAATQALLLTAEHDGPPDFARVGLMRALYPKGEPVFDASRKETRWGRRTLARER